MNVTAKNILVPVDFSEQSLIALSQSYNIAKLTGSEITLLKVIEQHGALSNLFSRHEDAVTAEIQKKLDALARETEKKAGVKVNDMIAKGKAYEKIIEVAEMINAGLIIMGTSGGNGLRRRIIGSNALHVVKETRCPVITIKGKHHREGCEIILLPLDLTKETRQKVAKGIELAKLFGSSIHAVSALFTKDEFIVNKLTRQLQQVQKFISDKGVNCEAEVLKGIKGDEKEADVILEYAGKVKADLIMIMTQQENEITELFLGSTAQKIISHSDIPVISLVPQKGLGEGDVSTPY